MKKTIGQVELDRVIEFLKEHGPPPAGEIAAPPPPRIKGVKPPAKPDRDFSAIDTQFRIAMADLRASAGVLANPVVTRQVMLDQPFLIWSYPLSDILVSSAITPTNSAARLSYYANHGTNNRFTFQFFWTNENESPAVINIYTRLVLTGDCFAQARAGVFSGYKTTISMSGTLYMLRAGAAWGSDPLTGNQTYVPPTQQSQSVGIVSLEAKGGHVFQGAGTDSQSFAGQAFDLSYASLLVPSGASVIFMPSIHLYCQLEGDTLEDVVDIDFATNGRAMRCPFVMLTVQTPT